MSTGRSVSRVSGRTTRSRFASRCPSRLTTSRLTPNINGRSLDSRKDAYLITWRHNAILNAENLEFIKKKKNYWQQFANERVKELLRDTEPLFPEKQPLYTAHCGPKPRVTRSSSIDSVETDISLLSISTMRDDAAPEMTNRKRKKKARKEPGAETGSQKGDPTGKVLPRKRRVF